MARPDMVSTAVPHTFVASYQFSTSTTCCRCLTAQHPNPLPSPAPAERAESLDRQHPLLGIHLLALPEQLAGTLPSPVIRESSTVRTSKSIAYCIEPPAPYTEQGEAVVCSALQYRAVKASPKTKSPCRRRSGCVCLGLTAWTKCQSGDDPPGRLFRVDGLEESRLTIGLGASVLM